MSKPWFRKRKGFKSPDKGWGFVPISFEGVTMYLILLALAIFLAIHFQIWQATVTQGLSFGLLFIFVLIIFAFLARMRTLKE